MKNVTNIYYADSDSDNEVEFTTKEVNKKIKSLPKNLIIYSASTFLLNVAQSILENSHQHYVRQKLDITQKNKISSEEPQFYDWKKYLPGLYIFNKSNDTETKNKTFEAYYDRYHKQINSYLSEIADYKQQYSKKKKQSLKNIEKYLKNTDVDIGLDQLDFENHNQLRKALITNIKVAYFKPTVTIKIVDEIIFGLEESKTIDKKQLKLNLKIYDNNVQYTEIKNKIISDFKQTNFLQTFYEKFEKIKKEDFEYIPLGTKRERTRNELDEKFINFNQENIKNYIIAENDYEKVYSVKLLLDAEYDNIKNINVQNALLNKKLSSYRPNKAFFEDKLEHFSNFKLNNKINRSIIKSKAIDGITDSFVYEKHLPLDNIASGSIKIFSSGSRTDYENLPLRNSNSSAYSNLIKEITNSSYLNTIPNILKNPSNTDILKGQTYLEQEFLLKFLNLLFNCETERNVSAFITNAMFFDLVSENLYELDDLPIKLPMAIKKDEHNPQGAVPGIRYMLDLLGGTYGSKGEYLIKRQYYDFGPTNEDKGKELAARDTALLIDWLCLQKILDPNQLIKFGDKENQQESLKEITQSIREMPAHNRKEQKDIWSAKFNAISQEVLVIFNKDGIARTIFKAFHNLIYDWYGIRLNWLYSFEEFKADQVINFKAEYIKIVEELFNIISPKGETIKFAWHRGKTNFSLDNNQLNQLTKDFIQNSGNIKYLMHLVNLLHCKELYALELNKEDISNTINKIWETQIVQCWEQIKNGYSFKEYGSEVFDKWVKKLWNSTSITNKESELNLDQQNAFNQSDNVKYEYQDKDINFLAPYLLKDKIDIVRFGIYHSNNDQGHTSLEDITTNFSNLSKPILGLYNPGGHWVVFAVINIEDSVHVLYKDSIKDGEANYEKFKVGIMNAYNVLKEENIHTQYGNILEQIIGLDCGIFALSNMQIIAEKLNLNQSELIKEFTTVKFCTFEQARNLRKGGFAHAYVESWYEHMVDDSVKVEKRKSIISMHEPELDQIVAKLEKNNSITIKPLKAGVDFKRDKEKNTIGIEISLPDNLDFNSSNYTYPYSYRITWSSDMNANQVKEFFQKKIPILENIDFMTEDQVITITYDKLSTQITQQPKVVNLKNINVTAKEVTLEELSKDLNVIEANKVDVVKNIVSSKYSVTLKGLDKKEDMDIDCVNSYFGKYTIDSLDNILSLRLKDLKLYDIKTLQGIFINQELNNIRELLSDITNAKKQTVLVSINLFNKHAAGLVFDRTNDNSIEVKYLDPENKPLPVQLEQIFNKYNLSVEQLMLEQQKYSNCGPEVIENFILYLTGKRVSQEQAIELHSKLVENALLGIKSSGVHLLFEELANYYQQPENNLRPGLDLDCTYNEAICNFDYESTQVDILGQHYGA